MSIQASGSKPSQSDPDVNLLYRVEEDLGWGGQFGFGANVWAGANQPASMKYKGPATVDVGTSPFFLNNGAINGGGIDVNGRRWIQQSSAAGSTVRRGGGLGIPMSQLFQTGGAEFVQGTLKSYLFEIQAVRFTAQAAANAWYMCVEDSDGGFRAILTRPGAGWVCDPAINAGRLTPMIRRINGAAMTVGPDSGFSLLNQYHSVGIRYIEGATQRLEYLIDGAVRHTLSGDANVALVNPGGGSQYPHWTPSYGWSGGAAGSVVQYGPAIFEVRAL